MKIITGFIISLLLLSSVSYSRDIHVSIKGNNSNPGTLTAPLRTIQHAAELAQPGDTIIVHGGIYREYINPPRGGTSDTKRIVYEAAPGEKAVIKGSEIIKNWNKVKDNVWEVIIPNSFFGKLNPYRDLIHGDWYKPNGRDRHTGAVYLNGNWLNEAAKLDELFKSPADDSLWFSRVEKDSTRIWVQFGAFNPNGQEVEINVRKSVFYPEKAGINYITVKGFILEDAATQWAPPTAQQEGLIGPNWSKGWIIENNIIKYSMCSGISLGKYGDKWDNTSENSAEGYVKTVERALKHGWDKNKIGHHIVRNNVISHCEQAGIVGSLGPAFSIIVGNTIYDICSRHWLLGAERAGIKLHGAVDVVISHNHIYNTLRGIWLDWMAQGTRVSDNLFNDNTTEDIFVEVDHGPYLVGNNIFLSNVAISDRSQGGAYVHNLFAGAIKLLRFDRRETPYLKAHSTEIAGFHNNPLGDDRYYNNIFMHNCDLSNYDTVGLPMHMDGNVYLDGARKSIHDENVIINQAYDPEIKLIDKQGGYYLQFKFDNEWISEDKRKLVTTKLLGKAIISGQPYEKPDGLPIQNDTDYFGNKRNKANPTPGPFEKPGNGLLLLKVW